MPVLMWSSALEVGVAEIDEQHKRLVEIANHVVQCVREKTGTLGVDEVVQSLREYTTTHFHAEERIMESLRYPGHGGHHVEHERLLHQVKIWQREIFHHEALTVDEVRDFLREWLIGHILKSDMAFKEWLQQNATCTLKEGKESVTKCRKK